MRLNQDTIIRIEKGLDIAVGGEPAQLIEDGGAIRSVGLVGGDYPGLRPRMLVKEGDRVRHGQALFTDRRRPGVHFTAPGNGIVRRITRGARQVLQSVAIDLTGEDAESFSQWPADALAGLRRDQVTQTLLDSGLWTAFRTRPYSKVPGAADAPSAIFVTAIDTNPLAANPEIVIAERAEDFVNGLTVIAHLTEGPVFVCRKPDAEVPVGHAAGIEVVEFTGPHPAGLPGTHIHFLRPVSANRVVWHLGYQDVIAIGALFTTGRLPTERIIALAGPVVNRPRLLRTRIGANTDDLIRGELHDGARCVISGSVLSGRQATGVQSYLGRFDTQLCVIPEAPATTPHGTRTAMLPIEAFERVMPLDILATQLLRALLVGDAEMARALGCLELDEEDLSLCTYLCPGKLDYAPLLTACLDTIEREG